MMQNGPGAENGFAGVAQAYAESVPILLLPAGFARNRRGVHPNFNPTRSYETITKWSQEINLVERIPDLMRRAFAKLRSGRLGPVLLEIPQDIALGELKPELFNYTSPPRLRQAADPEAIKQAARVLLEVNCSGEDAKQGFEPAEVPTLANRLNSMDGIRVEGLMTMAALASQPEEARPAFRKLATLARELKPLVDPRHALGHLSMGMSNDFEVAIEEGATLIRLGTILVGGLEPA